MEQSPTGKDPDVRVDTAIPADDQRHEVLHCVATLYTDNERTASSRSDNDGAQVQHLILMTVTLHHPEAALGAGSPHRILVPPQDLLVPTLELLDRGDRQSAQHHRWATAKLTSGRTVTPFPLRCCTTIALSQFRLIPTAVLLVAVVSGRSRRFSLRFGSRADPTLFSRGASPPNEGPRHFELI